MQLEKLLPKPTLTNTEMVELATAINIPVVQKYLKFLQWEALRDIAGGMPAENESAESYLRRQAHVVGGMAAIEVLLSIEAPAKA